MSAGQIRVFNTLSMQKEPLVPLRPHAVGLYVCGPTTYSFIHIGNARTFTVFDVVVRYLRFRGFAVTYVRNFTDIDDKIIQAAHALQEDPLTLSERYVKAFWEDADALKLLRPDFAPKVTDHIPEILTMIQKLLDEGVAYASQGDVYFSVSQYPAYARLSHRNLEELRAGERVMAGDQKREPLDFALWKAAKPGEPAWDAPWGRGRPGWHIECSAMSEKFLGVSFDLHGGGLDLIFPHHENELAQSEASSHAPLAKYWMHCNFLDLEGAKMSKSLGNVVRLRDALEQVDAEALRYFFLSAHYRTPVTFADKSLHDADARLEYFYETLEKVDGRLAGKDLPAGPFHGDPDGHLARFQAALDDDFNVPGGIAVLSAVFNELNELTDKPPVKDKPMVARTLKRLRQHVDAFAQVLGMLEEVPRAWLQRRRDRAVKHRGIEVAQVERLLADRLAARAAKDFSRADALRGALKAMGVEVMDTAAGTTWKVSP